MTWRFAPPAAYRHLLYAKLHLRHKRTETRLFVRLSVVSTRGVHPMGGRSATLYRNLKGMEG